VVTEDAGEEWSATTCGSPGCVASCYLPVWIRHLQSGQPHDPEAGLTVRPERQAFAPRVATIAWRAALASAALLAAYLIPLAAVLLVWPVLFAIPGWWLLGWSRAPLTGPERVGLAVVLSVALTAHLVYWCSWLLGAYARETILLATLFAMVPVLLDPAPFSAKAVLASLARSARRNVIPLALAGTAGGFVAVVLGLSIWSVDEGGLRTSAIVWSDLLVHLSIAESVNAANFPPDVPYFAGHQLTYHWFSDFHAAIVARAARAFAIPAFVIGSSLLAGTLALLVYALARRLTRSRRAAALATVLAIFGGGMGYLRFLKDWASGLGDPLTLLTSRIYDNQWFTDWPHFSIPSVMGTGLLSHRATTAGLPMLIGAVLLLMIGLPRRSARAHGAIDRPRMLLLAGVLGAMSAPFHFFFFPAVLLLSLAYVVAADRLTDPAAPRNALALLGPYVLSIPFVLPPLLTAAGSNRFQLRLWWDAPVAEGPLGVAFFYATNLGVPFLLALVALVWRGLPARRFLLIWIVAMFAIPNVAVFSHISFDMNKYFQVMWMATAVAAAWLIRAWHPAAVALVIAASVASPIQVGVYGVATRYQVLGAADLRAADWARTATDPGSVFVTNGWLHAFTDLAGRLRVHSFGPYIQNIGYDPGPREAAVTTIYCGGDAAESARLVRSLGARYVVDSSRPEGCAAPVRFEEAPGFSLVFEDAGLRVWELAD
jgi:hypothetical protein